MRNWNAVRSGLTTNDVAGVTAWGTGSGYDPGGSLYTDFALEMSASGSAMQVGVVANYWNDVQSAWVRSVDDKYVFSIPSATKVWRQIRVPSLGQLTFLEFTGLTGASTGWVISAYATPVG